MFKKSKNCLYLSTRCPIVMGLGPKGSIFNAQIGRVAKLKLNLTDM